MALYIALAQQRTLNIITAYSARIVLEMTHFFVHHCNQDVIRESYLPAVHITSHIRALCAAATQNLERFPCSLV